MHISAEGTLGISLGLVALCGTGAIVLATGPLLTAIGWACVITAIAGGIALVCYHLREKGVRLGTILVSLGTIFIIFGGAIGLIGAFMMDESNGRPEAADNSPLDQTVQTVCEQAEMPLTIPQNNLFELMLNHQFMTAGGTFTWFMSRPGTPVNTISDDRPNHVYRCRFLNFGTAAVLNFETEINVRFTNGKSSKITTPLQVNIAGNG